jgi:hypothetical protein
MQGLSPGSPPWISPTEKHRDLILLKSGLFQTKAFTVAKKRISLPKNMYSLKYSELLVELGKLGPGQFYLVLWPGKTRLPLDLPSWDKVMRNAPLVWSNDCLTKGLRNECFLS